MGQRVPPGISRECEPVTQSSAQRGAPQRDRVEDTLPGWEAFPRLASGDILVPLRSALSEHPLSAQASHLRPPALAVSSVAPWRKKTLDQFICSGNMGGPNKLRIEPQTQIALGGVNSAQWLSTPTR